MQDPGSLENLHDIAVPPPISWWPLAAGWWFVIATSIALLIVLAYRGWRRWKRDSYRRAALAELANAGDDTAVVAILKRTALCAEKTGGSEKRAAGSLTGQRWCGWLEERCDASISGLVQDRLTVGVYQDGQQLTPELVSFARRWIATHRIASQACETTEGHELT